MDVSSSDIIADRGINLHKLTRLLVTCFGDASLAVMGSEFGHSDTFDARYADQWTQKPLVRWEDADNKSLKWKHLEMWEAHMNRVSMLLKLHTEPIFDVLVQDDKAKVLALEKAKCLFAFNFHPSDEVSRYRIKYPGASSGTEVVVALDSNDPRFNGNGTGVTTVEVEKDKYVALTLPPRTAVVLASKEAAKALEVDRVLAISSVDDFVDYLKK